MLSVLALLVVMCLQVCMQAIGRTACARACSPLLALARNSASSLAASTAGTWSLTRLGAPARACTHPSVPLPGGRRIAVLLLCVG